jgi:hypothetical protein
MRVFTRIGTAALCGLVLLATLSREAAADIQHAASRAVTTSYTGRLWNDAGKTSVFTSSNAAHFFSKINNTSVGNVGDSYASFTNGTGPVEFRTFCVDLATVIVTTVNQADVIITNDPSNDEPAYLGVNRNIGAAGVVVNTYAAYNSTGFNNAAWSALATAAGTDLVGIGDDEKAAILQTAVWAKAYGKFASITGGGAEITKMNLLLDTMLALATGSQYVGFINYPPADALPSASPLSQDMLFAVPEPGSISIAALGALGFLGYGIRRRLRKS